MADQSVVPKGMSVKCIFFLINEERLLAAASSESKASYLLSYKLSRLTFSLDDESIIDFRKSGLRVIRHRAGCGQQDQGRIFAYCILYLFYYRSANSVSLIFTINGQI